METPVLTIKQKNQSFSAKKQTKKRPNVNIRNVLGITRSFQCPSISDSDATLFNAKFVQLFKFTPPPKNKWSVIKKMSAEERSEYRRKLYEANKKQHPSSSRLVFGINAVSRAIETNSTSLVLLASNIEPPTLIKHILEICSVQNIPMFQVPDLRVTLKHCFGYPALAVAFKNIPKQDPLNMIVKTLKENYLKLAKKNVTKNTKLLTECNMAFEEINDENESDEEKIHKSAPIPKAVYLTRESSNVRAFVPPNSVSKIKEETKKETNENAEFIKFGNEDDTEAEILKETPMIKKKNKKKNIPKNDKGGKYENLKVKRLKPNPNRQKKKNKSKL